MEILLFLNDENRLDIKCELLNILSFIKKQEGGKLIVAVPEDTKKEFIEEIKKWAIEKIYIVDKKMNSAEYFADQLCYIHSLEKVDIIAMGNSLLEREIAPFVAAKENLSFFPNAIEFKLGNKDIVLKRFVYGTKAVQKEKVQKSGIVITFSNNIYKKDEKSTTICVPEIVILNKIYSGKMNVNNSSTLCQIEEKKMQKHDLENSKIVIGIGKGIKGKENFEMVEKLAELIGGSIGVTRSVVDNGWRPEYEKIGQTGKIIKPELYIGFGISGAMQHMVGVKQARHIIMVNENPNAESFYSSDLGIVSDLFKIIPGMINNLEKK